MKTFLLGISLGILGLILCVSLALSQDQVARMNVGVVGGGVPAAGGGCSETPFDSNGSSIINITSIGEPATYFVGQLYTMGSARTVCRLDFYIYNLTGDISAQTFNAKIYTLNGNALDSLQGTSDSVSGGDITADTWEPFVFSTPVSLSNGVAYAFVLTINQATTPNARSGYSADGAISGKVRQWASDKSYQGEIDGDAMMKFYAQ